MDQPNLPPHHRPEPEAATCSCIILCDDVHSSAIRGKHTLVGIVTGIMVRELPAQIGPFMCYVRLSNVYPHARIRVDLRLDGATDTLFATPIQQPPPTVDPLGLHTFVIRTPAFVVQSEGRYLLTVWSNEIPAAATPIQIAVPPRSDDHE